MILCKISKIAPLTLLWLLIISKETQELLWAWIVQSVLNDSIKYLAFLNTLASFR